MSGALPHVHAFAFAGIVDSCHETTNLYRCPCGEEKAQTIQLPTFDGYRSDPLGCPRCRELSGFDQLEAEAFAGLRPWPVKWWDSDEWLAWLKDGAAQITDPKSTGGLRTYHLHGQNDGREVCIEIEPHWNAGSGGLCVKYVAEVAYNAHLRFGGVQWFPAENVREMAGQMRELVSKATDFVEQHAAYTPEQVAAMTDHARRTAGLRR